MLGDEIAALGWCSGRAIPTEMVQSLSAYLVHPGGAQAQVDAQDWLVIVSQTCDVVAKTLEQEPFVEVLHCKPIDSLRGEYQGRSTRRLDFRPDRTGLPDVRLTAHAVADRYLVPRDMLRNVGPDYIRKLDGRSTARVLVWYSLRYGRPAWPTAFVERITKKAKKSLENALKPIAADLAEVRVTIAEKDKELTPSDSYHVAVFFVVDEAMWEADLANRTVVQNGFNQFVSALRSCAGIEVDEASEVYSGAQFSWQMTQASDEWNFANLSSDE